MNGEKDKLIQFIRGIHAMPHQQAIEIVTLFKEKEFVKTDFLLSTGRICNEYHVLEKGFARAYTYDLGGNDVTTAFYSDNQVVCELFSFFKRIPSKENIQALTECKSWYITYDELQLVFHSMPQFREFGRSILVNAYASLKQRMFSTLHETAEERYGSMIKSNPDIFQHAALKNIASFLGVTDTSLSRIRKEFAKNSSSH